MSLKEEKINREIEKLINIRRFIQSCDSVSIVKEGTIFYLFNQDDAEKDIISCMMSGITVKIKQLFEERKKIRRE